MISKVTILERRVEALRADLAESVQTTDMLLEHLELADDREIGRLFVWGEVPRDVADYFFSE